LHYAKNGKIDALLGASYNAERDEYMFYPVKANETGQRIVLGLLRQIMQLSI
jgi:hypothetical protein